MINYVIDKLSRKCSDIIIYNTNNACLYIAPEPGSPVLRHCTVLLSLTQTYPFPPSTHLNSQWSIQRRERNAKGIMPAVGALRKHRTIGRKPLFGCLFGRQIIIDDVYLNTSGYRLKVCLQQTGSTGYGYVSGKRSLSRSV